MVSGNPNRTTTTAIPRPASNTHRKFRRTINRQGLLGRISRCARSNHYTSAFPLLPHIAGRQFDEIQHAAVIDVDDVVFWLEQLASFIESVFEIIVFFRDARIGDRDIDGAGLLERGFEILPGCCIAFDECGVGTWVFRGRREIEDEGFGALGDEDLDRCKPDARSATCKAGQKVLFVV